MGFWENITGQTINGISIIGMPEQLKLVYSIRDHIQRIINIRRVPGILAPLPGIDEIPEVLTAVPPWIRDFAASLKKLIINQDGRIAEVYLYSWQIEKRQACLTGKMTVVLHDRRMIRLQMFLPDIGNNRVQFAAAGYEE